MRFYSRKAPRSKAETLLDQISTGKCDDLVVKELPVAVSELTDPAEKELVLTALKDIALKSGNPASVAYAIKSLLAFQFMEEGLEDSLEIRILALIDGKVAFTNRVLQEAMAEFLYKRVSEHVDRAAPFTGALIHFLDERTGTGGTTAYNSLMIVAANRPEFFEHCSGNLIKMLGSINNATRVQTARLIAVLAMSHPEYVASAEKTLLHLSSFNPDAELKNSASEAWQILSGRLRPEERAPTDDIARRRYEEETTGGLAEIMRRRMGKDKKVPYESRIDKRLLSMATNFARKADRAYQTDGAEAEETETMGKIMDDFSEIAQSIKAGAGPVEPAAATEAGQPAAAETQEEAELRRVMEKVKDDFSINAGSILDAIGMGHLAKRAMMDEVKPRPAEVPVRDRPKRTRLTRTEPVRREPPQETPPATIAGEEEDVSPKEFIASIESIMSRTEKEAAAATDTGTGTASKPPEAAAAADGSGSIVADNAAAARVQAPEKAAAELVPAAEQTPPVAQAEAAKPEVPEAPEAPEVTTRAEEPPKLPRTPIVPSGVRISAMKFRSIDQSKTKKTPTPPKISIKPHIKPLSKTPMDVVKSTQSRQQPLASVPGAVPGLEQKTEAPQGYVVCHSCNAKMPEDSQRCAICGSDLKAPKVRCRMCGEINPRGAGKCSRCSSSLETVQ